MPMSPHDIMTLDSIRRDLANKGETYRAGVIQRAIDNLGPDALAPEPPITTITFDPKCCGQNKQLMLLLSHEHDQHCFDLRADCTKCGDGEWHNRVIRIVAPKPTQVLVGDPVDVAVALIKDAGLEVDEAAITAARAYCAEPVSAGIPDDVLRSRTIYREIEAPGGKVTRVRIDELRHQPSEPGGAYIGLIRGNTPANEATSTFHLEDERAPGKMAEHPRKREQL